MTTATPVDARLEPVANVIAEWLGLDYPGPEEYDGAERVLNALGDLKVTEAADAVDDTSTPAGTRFTPQTSIEGAYDVMGRAKGQRWKLLREYRAVSDSGLIDGLTDEQVAERVSLDRSCYWKRCGELRDLGLIEPTGETRQGAAGSARIVCRLSSMGLKVLDYAATRG